MKSYLSKSILFCFIAFTSAAVFAQKKGDYTILQDSMLNPTSIIYTDEYINEAERMLFLTKNDMQREHINELPGSLEKFYTHDYDEFFWLKYVMSVDSAEGLRVRKEPSLKSEKICTLPDNFNVVITCLGNEVSIDGIKSAWVEIVLPQYLWSGPKAEFGWVFGGYLKDMVIHEGDFSLARQNDNSRFYHDEGDFYTEAEGDFHIPYGSQSLYDITGGKSFYDRYTSEQAKIYDNDFWEKIRNGNKEIRKNWLEQERKALLELLKLSYAGVVPNNDKGSAWRQMNFYMFWQPVREKRRIHPVYYSKDFKLENFGLEPDGTYIDESISLDLKKRNLFYTNPDSKKVFPAEIPGEYMTDFSLKDREELKIFSYQNESFGMTEPFIRMKKKIYENEIIYHYEVFYYHIIDGKLIKFLKITTCPELLDRYSWNVTQYDNDDSTAYFIVYSEYDSLFHRMIHDDVLKFKPCEEFPYIQIAKDTCHNYDIIQIGPNFNSDEK